ncbi:MAG TPA: PEP-CTERM/exosortase system-associated acyltransferase [Rhizomicrobium sp.]|nr:PEP-CTERM/exosortase system-associated acyltransferase [Rhizomicrobium sp.]
MNATTLFPPCAQTPSGTATDILTRYNSFFHTRPANSPALIRMAQAIRYQVYCLERKFENEAEHDEGLECDGFDSAAVHALIFHRPTSEAIGTARLIPLNGMDVLQPIRRLLRENGLRARDHVPLATTAEISRFAISNQFRRGSTGHEAAGRLARECRSNLPCLGLIQELLRQSLAQGLTHWAAVMEPKLLRMLAVMGIHFTPVGPLVSHHGLRQPSYCRLSDMLERLKQERPDHWMVVTDGGTLMPGNAVTEERRAA